VRWTGGRKAAGLCYRAGLDHVSRAASRPTWATTRVPAARARSAHPRRGPARVASRAAPVPPAIDVTNAGIRCDFPASDGQMQITVLGQPSDPNLSVYLFVEAGKVTVRYDSGSGSTYVERDFSGTGVTNFDAAKGAQIDTQLSEVATTQAHGNLGGLTSISGTTDCGNQLPGSSTLTFSGATLKGTISGGLNPVNVECVTGTTNGSSVSVVGLVQVGSAPTYFIMSVSPGTFTAYPVGGGFFRKASTATATLTATGAHIDGDAVEQLAAGATAAAHTIHVSGDVVCGTTISS